MNNAPAQLPGLYFTRAARAHEAAPLRSDVAGFAGRARRGPLGQRVRVEGWNDYLRWFGGFDAEAETPYALRGYFDNGGLVAHVVRIGLPGAPGAARAASALWRPLPAGSGAAPPEVPRAFAHRAYRVMAASPGHWANHTRIHARFRRDGALGGSELDLAIEAPGEPPEYLNGLALGAIDADGADPLAREVARRSALVRLVPADGPNPAAGRGPRRCDWQLTLAGGTAGAAGDGAAYNAALDALNEEPEVALLVLPDLHRDFGAAADPVQAQALLADWLERVDAGRDRMLLLDAPPGHDSAAQLAGWLDAVAGQPRRGASRAAALYHPWLSVPDPLGSGADPLRALPPCGHIAGLISKLDRERGPHYTPANAPLQGAVDLALALGNDELAMLDAGGVNLVVCSAGQGLQVRGSSTLARIPRVAGAPRAFVADHFIACRRLLHRLVRAIRRVAEPLVFDTNGPELWLAFVRAINTVLLEAWRGGGLKGARPAEAFYVRCDERTNPPEQRELGLCLCEIGVAPVAPMEFIVLRVALGGEGALEVFES